MQVRFRSGSGGTSGPSRCYEEKKGEWGIRDRKTLFNQVFFVVKREREKEKTRWIRVRHDLEKEKTSIKKTHPFKSCYFGGFRFPVLFSYCRDERGGANGGGT